MTIEVHSYPEAHTSEDRGYIHVSNLPLVDKPISIGWLFSVVELLPEEATGRPVTPRQVRRVMPAIWGTLAPPFMRANHAEKRKEIPKNEDRRQGHD